MGVYFYREMSNFGYLKSLKKSEKVAMPEEIGSGNDIILSKIGQGNELRC